jgi:hypothetical protein
VLADGASIAVEVAKMPVQGLILAVCVVSTVLLIGAFLLVRTKYW